ncbi:CAP domain-containing protein [uncultured Brevibacillus sp.]|uniref:CAP domain-containing protein n=1 Tax=uncultured Brevibacillus sp. TaxID=169970 RepID=UPI0025993A11|nr:CAP domain-containing protein [uncultured Brevibacillus sp.]
MKRFGTATIAMTLGLGLALTGFSTSAFAASTNCPVQSNFQSQLVPFLQQMQKSNQASLPTYSQPVSKQNQPFNFVNCQQFAPKQYFVQPTQQAPVQAPVPQAPAQPAATPASETNQAQASNFVKQVADLVNQERAKAGLKPVQLDSALSDVALAKAADMSNNHYFDHNSPTYGSPFDMMKKYGISFMTAGENIAMGQRSPEEVMNQWMNSEGHRQNIMNPAFTKIGVGYTNGYWVQEFIG